MRGSVSLTEAYFLTQEDQDIINELIKENMDTSKKTGRDFW